MAMVLVDHGHLDRHHLRDAILRRWPETSVIDFTVEEPSTAMNDQDAAELAGLRRGAEPLRLLVRSQRGRAVRAERIIEPMPVVV